MIGRVNTLLAARSRLQLTVLCVLLIAAVGALDYATGYEISFSVFYLLPVSVAAWYLGSIPGLLVSGASAATWLNVDLAAEHQYSSAVIPVWNALVRLLFFLVVTRLLIHLHEALRQQAELARRDALTGALNGRAFRDRCDFAFQIAARRRESVALAYLDIDGFKDVNDRFGHAAGDRLLQRVVAMIADRARASDAVGRLGGDEFAILLPKTDLAGAGVFIDDLRTTLRRFADENGWPFGVSIGVAAFTTPPVSTDEAIRIADELMYEVKGRAKNDATFREFGARPPAVSVQAGVAS
jgi:diguanylate cyclase (GGDEF)-like protein